MTGMGAAGQTNAVIVRDTMRGIGIRDIAVVGGMTGTAEVGIDGTIGQGPGRRGGHDPGMGTTEDGDGPGRE